MACCGRQVGIAATGSATIVLQENREKEDGSKGKRKGRGRGNDV